MATHKKHDDEKTGFGGAMFQSYGLQRATTAEVVSSEVVAGAGNYDIDDMVTVRVFGKVSGTVFTNRELWNETLWTSLLYWAVFLCLFVYRPDDFSKFVGKESSIRAFIAMFSTLIGLLLSFYTALNLGRWWQMRMAVEKIQGGNKKLVMMLSQITDDQEVLRNVTRIGRASLFLVFATSQHQEGQDPPRKLAQQKGLLTEEEVQKLEQLMLHMHPFVQAETLCAWLANLVTRINDKGLVKGPLHYCALMAAVEECRSGIDSIHTFLDTPIPMGYVHLLCLMVKLHNFILTVLMAMASVMFAGGAKGMQPVGMFRTGFRAFFMPFLYNAILILNAEVTDPFGEDEADFDFEHYDVSVAMCGKAFSETLGQAPDWVTKVYDVGDKAVEP